MAYFYQKTEKIFKFSFGFGTKIWCWMEQTLTSYFFARFAFFTITKFKVMMKGRIIVSHTTIHNLIPKTNKKFQTTGKKEPFQSQRVVPFNLGYINSTRVLEIDDEIVSSTKNINIKMYIFLENSTQIS